MPHDLMNEEGLEMMERQEAKRRRISDISLDLLQSLALRSVSIVGYLDALCHKHRPLGLGRRSWRCGLGAEVVFLCLATPSSFLPLDLLS